MDFRNKSMLNPTTFDVNKALMRCLTKNISMFGLGLYIYQGEDLPNAETDVDRVISKDSTTVSQTTKKQLTRNEMIGLFRALDTKKYRFYMNKYKELYGKSSDVDPMYLKNEFLIEVGLKEKWC